MILFTTPIVPYKGTGMFNLNADYSNVLDLLQSQNALYKEEVSKPNSVDPPWKIITLYEADCDYGIIELFFAQDRLFKICLCEGFHGALPNGIHNGMSLQQAQDIDSTLRRNEDWDEIYESSEGYWLEYDTSNWNIIIISIFIPAVERGDFYEYRW